MRRRIPTHHSCPRRGCQDAPQAGNSPACTGSRNRRSPRVAEAENGRQEAEPIDLLTRLAYNGIFQEP